MSESYDIVVRVVSQKGVCGAEHNVGDEWIIRKNMLTPGGMCIAAYNAIYPYLMTLMFGGSFPWEDNPDITRIACQDPDNPVILELKRIRE